MLTPVMDPVVVLISSDEDVDDETNLHEVDVAVISSSPEDDGDEVSNLDQQPESEHAGDYNKLDSHESDEKEDNDFKRSDEEECFDNCDKRPDMVGCFNQGSNDLEELSLYECKTYLRKHGMRVTGTKEECIQRIKEHGRLKDGRGESLYPRSSFSIICTGDACKGDIVFFKQDICKGGNVVGRRSVAGRILKESYGALNQQHTFSVEVLWSKRSKKLNPLSILLVKGRNLYKFGTFRQPWKNEAERSVALREKHSRGDAARHKRKLRQTEFTSSNNKSAKRQKVSPRGPSQTKHPIDINKHKSTLLAFHPYRRQDPIVNANPEKNPNPNPSSYIYPDHHQQETSSSIPYGKTLLPNQLLFGFPGYGLRNEQQGPNQVFYQPPDHHCNCKQPISRLKGGAKSLFPRSSFFINCTGYACKGDVVLFKQCVYKKGNIVGRKRSVAGRIVKESFHASQHRFTIEVLWTKHNIELPALSTLVVTGRELYRFGTFRQPWKNEAERSKVLGKKQRRRASRRERKLRKRQTASNNDKGVRHQQVTCRVPSQSKQKFAKSQGAGPVTRSKTAYKRKTVCFQIMKSKKSKQLMFLQDPNPTQIDKQASDERPVAALAKKSTTPQIRKAVWFQKTFKRSKKQTFLPGPNPYPNPTQIDKQTSDERPVAALVKKSTTPQKRKAVWFQKMTFKRSKKQTFRPDPNPYPNPTQIDKQTSDERLVATLKKRTAPRKSKAVWLQKKRFNTSGKQTFRPDPNSYPADSTQIDKQKSAKRRVPAPSTPPHKTESVWSQKTEFNNNTQPTFHPNPCPNPHPNLGINTNTNPDHFPYFNHQLQEASLFITSLLHNQLSPWLQGYGHYNNGQWGPNNGFYQPPGYTYYNHQQPVPRYWFG